MGGFCRTIVVYVVLVCHTTAVPVPERQLPENRTSYAQQLTNLPGQELKKAYRHIALTTAQASRSLWRHYRFALLAWLRDNALTDPSKKSFTLTKNLAPPSPDQIQNAFGPHAFSPHVGAESRVELEYQTRGARHAHILLWFIAEGPLGALSHDSDSDEPQPLL